jgi:hypothetical protein
MLSRRQVPRLQIGFRNESLDQTRSVASLGTPILQQAVTKPQTNDLQQIRSFVSSTKLIATPASSPFDVEAAKPKTKKKKGRKKFIPPKAAVELTPKARKFFKLLLENPPRPDVVGKKNLAVCL